MANIRLQVDDELYDKFKQLIKELKPSPKLGDYVQLLLEKAIKNEVEKIKKKN